MRIVGHSPVCCGGKPDLRSHFVCSDFAASGEAARELSGIPPLVAGESPTYYLSGADYDKPGLTSRPGHPGAVLARRVG
jgi:hypothetical protein